MLVLCNFLIKLIVSAKKIHRDFRTHTTLYTKPIREIFYFHHLPKLFIGFYTPLNCDKMPAPITDLEGIV